MGGGFCTDKVATLWTSRTAKPVPFLCYEMPSLHVNGTSQLYQQGPRRLSLRRVVLVLWGVAAHIVPDDPRLQAEFYDQRPRDTAQIGVFKSRSLQGYL